MLSSRFIDSKWRSLVHLWKFHLGVTLSYSCFLSCCENENDKIKQNVQLHYLRTDFIVVIHESNGLEIKSPVLLIYGQTFCK